MGDPVNSLLYLKPAAIFIRDLVRFALWFLMVVDSSTAIMPWEPSIRAIHCPAFWPLIVEYASTFITKIVSPSNVSWTERISSFCFLLGPDTQRITLWGMSSDICSGISLATQLRYTPLGAITKAKLICPSKYSIAMLSMRTLDLPVPISMNRPNSGLLQP